MALVLVLCSDVLNSGLFYESSFSGKFEFSLRKLWIFRLKKVDWFWCCSLT